MVFVWNFFWPTKATPTSETVTVFLKGITKAHFKMASIDTSHSNAPQAWRNDGSPKYLSPAQVQAYIEASQVTWTNVECTEVTGGCTLPSVVVEPQGTVIYVSSEGNKQEL
eukprot:TRINITY_DN2118_c0_g1_i4.p1 TRINITY_DN2118_c0_g1~~TRINITY_DN2118_c0_g1_i4.p1  ORF type:complete len:111 (-),score=15.79 TRINITY_DN2118_c0_g1_i4:86-418(-)